MSDMNPNRRKDWFLKAEEIASLEPDDPQVKEMLDKGICNALQIWGPIEDWHFDVAKKGIGLIWNQPTSKADIAALLRMYRIHVKNPASLSREKSHEAGSVMEFVYKTVCKGQIPMEKGLFKEAEKFKKLTDFYGIKMWWCPMGEFDSAGTGFIRLARRMRFRSGKEAYEALKKFVMKTYLYNQAQLRRFNLTGITGFSFPVHYVYEWGLGLAKIERHNDAIGDLQQAIAFVRGAASQYARPWGLDLSRYRSCGASAGGYDRDMKRNGGWSPSYTKRHYYIGYMAGANIIKQEQSILNEGHNDGFYFIRDKKSKELKYTPMGIEAKKFGQFAFRNCTDRGKPFLPFAILMDFHNGWSREGLSSMLFFGPHKWFGRIPYTAADFMKEDFFGRVFPGSEYAGFPQSVPWTANPHNVRDPAAQERFRNLVKGGFDTRPYEPMGFSLFGDSFDVLYSNCSVDVLRKYKVVFLMDALKIDNVLRGKIEEYVRAGGVFVANVENIGKQEESLFGVRVTDKTIDSQWYAWSKCNLCGTECRERIFRIREIVPGKAKVVAESIYHPISYIARDKDCGRRKCLITSNAVGKGQAILTNPPYMFSERNMAILDVFIHYVSHLYEKITPVIIKGELCEYLVNRRDNGDLLVTVVNNFGSDWQGSISVKRKGGWIVRELTEGDRERIEFKNGHASVRVKVPKYDVRVFEFSK